MKKPQKSKSDAVNLSAKADATAKVIFERKKIINETIPPDVTRARAGAWLTLLSPLTEWAGLKGDELRHRREMLRIQREEALLEIAEKVNKGYRVSGVMKPIPNKFLVPFLEQASLEEATDSLIDLWANLFISAAENYNPHYVHFQNIIKQISAQQGEIFKEIISNATEKELELATDNIMIYYQSHLIAESIRLDLKNNTNTEKQDDPDSIFDFLSDRLSMIGIIPVYCAVSNNNNGEMYDVTFDDSPYSDKLEIDFTILESVGLLKRVDTGFTRLSEKYDMSIIYYHITNIGVHFAKACKLTAQQ